MTFFASLISKLHLDRWLRYGDRIQPVRDWFIMLGIAGAFLILGVAWNIWLFSRAESGEVIGSETVATSSPEAASIDKVKALFSVRAEEQAKYLGTYRFVDPSQ